MADKKNIIDHKRIRKIVGSFSWTDHRLITGGFLDDLPAEAISLYFFLTAVSDRYGVNFYHDDRICRILKLDLHGLGQVREDLITRGLIAYRYSVYQVLALPEKPITPLTAQQLAEEKRKMGLYYIQKIKDVVSHKGRRHMLKQATEEYLLWMIEVGYCRKVWNRTERILGYFLEFVQSRQIPICAVFTPFTLSAFEKEHKDKPYAARRVRGFWQYLFREGKINEPVKKKKQLPEIYEEYLLYYGQRVFPAQVQGARGVLSSLNGYFAEHNIALYALKIGDLDNFLALHTAPFTAKVRRNKRYYLQGFLRYLHYERKILKKDLAPLLVSPPVFAHAKPPKFLRTHEVKRLFDSAKPANAWGLRAYAMLYLAYTLGARSKEISLLTLDDISFSKREAILCDRKNTHPLILPLPEDAIKAIAAYIVGARPKSAHRTLFLSFQPPHRPLCSSIVARNITKLFRLAHVPGSAYWLRHTYAQNLLERGASIFEIKEMLGHESIQSAQNYLRVNTKLMQEVLLNDGPF